MSKRVYNSVGAQNQGGVSAAPESIIQEHTTVADTAASPNKPSAKFIITIATALVISAGAIFGAGKVVGNVFDEDNGAQSPDEAATAFVTAIDCSDDTLLNKYLPRAIRDSGFMADTMNISELRKLDAEHDITLSNIVIDNMSDLSDRTGALESGLFSVYNKQVKISDARRINVTANMSYDVDGSPHETQVSFNLISIKVNSKWYVYTGQQLSEDLDSADGDVVNILPAETMSTGQTYDIVSTYIKPVVKETRALNFSSSALDELTAGHMSIDNVEYVMPTSYESMMNLFILADDMFTDETRVVKQNYILAHLPIVFNKLDYTMTDFDISIGNATNKDIDIKDGAITTLYIGKPDEIYDYPDIYLPGNVTLGTAYNDVVQMYGRLDTYEDNEALVLHKNCGVIYQLNLGGNERNHIYFEFDYDNKLVAIQYYYYDLNEFVS